MKRFTKHLFIWLFLGSLAFAGTGLEQPPGEPPFGVAVQSDAPGTKLDGSLFIEFYNFDPFPNQFTADARIVLRLRKGNTADLDTFYGEAVDVNTADPAAVQAAITDTMGPKIIDRFFGNNNGIFNDDPSLEVKLKSLTEFGTITASTVLSRDALLNFTAVAEPLKKGGFFVPQDAPRLPPNAVSLFVLTDLQIAVD